MNKQEDNIKIDLRDVGSAGVDCLRIRSDIGRVKTVANELQGSVTPQNYLTNLILNCQEKYYIKHIVSYSVS
jgi:hypothetical protein